MIVPIPKPMAKKPSKQSLFIRLGGEQSLRAITQKMLRWLQNNPVWQPLLYEFTPRIFKQRLYLYLCQLTQGICESPAPMQNHFLPEKQLSASQIQSLTAALKMACEHFQIAPQEQTEILSLFLAL